jgi:flagellar hook-associated protein 2
MGSPITFSGFNNIDFGVVLNAIVQQERAPIAAIETQRTALQAQSTAFSTFATKLSALETAVENLANSDELAKVSATSSDDAAVGVSTGSATTTGMYEVVVSDLARAQVLASSSTYASPDTVVATSGAISLARFGDPPVDVVISGSMTLEDIAEAINNNPEAPVSASVVQVTPGQYRLVLTGRATGTSNAFTAQLSSPLLGGQGLTFTDTDNNGTFGDHEDDNIQQANNATLTVNQVPVTSASNSVEDVIPGVTLQLKKKDPASAITIDVSKDESSALAQLDAFATAYNDLVKFFGEQTSAAASGKPAIGRDPLVRGLRDALRTEMMESQVGAGMFERLAEVGVGFDGTGKIVIDKTVFKAKTAAAPADVRKLFAGEDGGGGRFGALKDLIVDYTEAGGLVADMKDRITAQVSQLGTRIATLEEQLALRRAALQREFIAADRAMSQLSSQGSSLTQLTGQFRLF